MFDKYDDLAIGPIGKADAMLLHAVLNYTQPTIAIEYGSLHGDSMKIIAPCVGALTAVDVIITQEVRDYAAGKKNIQLVEARMEEWIPHFQCLVDFVFFDAAHKFHMDAGAYVNIEPYLGPYSIIAVHDTCLWTDALPTPTHREFAEGHRLHVYQELLFCDFLNRKGWNQIDFGSKKSVRHGITLLQRK